ncbi:MAG: DisA protein [Desulfobacterium sp.]|nr:DisA protein [Desulfobacterium sp.]
MNNIFSFIQNLRWQDFIDIVINSYILFRIYVLFRGTTTFRVMLGITGLLFFQQIATALGLVVTSWLIKGITTVAAIIIIVIFQYEIRGVFQTTKWKNILWGIPKSYKVTPSETIVETIFDFSENRTGALIVFPGKENLYSSIQRGIPWQGRISKEMLNTIFWHNNPVHDGAIIIEGDKVAEVACILPLSERKDLPSYFGTRHRAAAGLAEISDALVVVVSEERGTVTAVKGTNIEKIKRKQDLNYAIDLHLGKENERGIVRKETFQLSIAAILSVVLIASIWSNFLRSSDTLINLEVPIQFKNRQSGMEVVEVSENNVNLQISGSNALLRSISSDKLYVEINLENVDIGENKFTLTSKNIQLPPGISLNQITPSTVNVLIDSIETKDLPVQVDWIGKLSQQLRLNLVYVEPSTIRLTGRSLLLKNLKTVYTKKVSLDIIEKSGTIFAGIAVDSQMKIATGQNETVKIKYNVLDRE